MTCIASDGKVAIITGVGIGIGKATARAFLNAGYYFTFAGRRKDGLESAIKEAGNSAIHPIAVPTDVTDEVAVENLFSKTRDTFLCVDVVFNNAGIFTPAIQLEDITLEQEHYQIRVGFGLCATPRLYIL